MTQEKRQKLEEFQQLLKETKLNETESINLPPAVINKTASPLPVKLIPRPYGHYPKDWSGCPLLCIGNNVTWYMFDLCAFGVERYKDRLVPIPGVGDCSNFNEIIAAAVTALGWEQLIRKHHHLFE